MRNTFPRGDTILHFTDPSLLSRGSEKENETSCEKRERGPRRHIVLTRHVKFSFCSSLKLSLRSLEIYLILLALLYKSQSIVGHNLTLQPTMVYKYFTN